ncbi:MAG: hypothetical protein GXO89_00780 [Chlorobi bacterium]|nr:hypothetical protein [Chlorobiota bacterium]
MKKVNTLIILMTILVFSGFGQNEDLNGNHQNSYSVYLETPLFFKDYSGDPGNAGFINFEYLNKRKKNYYNSFSLGLLFVLSIDNTVFMPSVPVLNFQYNAVFGKSKHFFETGVGFVAPIFILNLRFGYRLQLGQRLLFRAAYTPSLYLENLITEEESPPFLGYNALSISIGYRFAKNMSNGTWDFKYRWLSNIQMGWQAGFEHFRGHGGFYGTLKIEFLLARFEKVSLRSWIGYAYGPVNYPVQGLPLGFCTVYGKGRHFIETGMGFAWYPEPHGNFSGNYYALQPEIGYRVHLGKRFLARLAYTPYWWLADKKGREHIQKEFVNSATIGIGYRFH